MKFNTLINTLARAVGREHHRALKHAAASWGGTVLPARRAEPALCVTYRLQGRMGWGASRIARLTGFCALHFRQAILGGNRGTSCWQTAWPAPGLQTRCCYWAVEAMPQQWRPSTRWCHSSGGPAPAGAPRLKPLVHQSQGSCGRRHGHQERLAGHHHQWLPTRLGGHWPHEHWGEGPQHTSAEVLQEGPRWGRGSFGGWACCCISFPPPDKRKRLVGRLCLCSAKRNESRPALGEGWGRNVSDQLAVSGTWGLHSLSLLDLRPGQQRQHLLTCRSAVPWKPLQWKVMQRPGWHKQRKPQCMPIRYHRFDDDNVFLARPQGYATAQWRSGVSLSRPVAMSMLVGQGDVSVKLPHCLYPLAHILHVSLVGIGRPSHSFASAWGPRSHIHMRQLLCEVSQRAWICCALIPWARSISWSTVMPGIWLLSDFCLPCLCRQRRHSCFSRGAANLVPCTLTPHE